MSLLLALILACGREPAPPVARAVPGGIEVEASSPLDRVTISERHGAPLASRRLQAPLRTATVPARWSPGQDLVAEVWSGARRWTVPVDVPADDLPVTVEVQAPLGQRGEVIEDGEVVPLVRVEGAGALVGLALTARRPVDLRVTRGAVAEERRLGTAGERAVLTWETGPGCEGAGEGCVSEERVVVEATPLDAPGETDALVFTVQARVVPASVAREQLALEAVVFPADSAGEADLVRPPDRVTLPSAWWTALLRTTGLGFRPRDPTLPWAWQGVAVRNKGVTPLNLIIRSRIIRSDGSPDPAFRPRLRDADDGTGAVSALLRAPPGRAVAALPVFVDEAKLGPGPWTREVSVTPLGSTRPLHTWTGPLVVRRGSAVVSAGLAVTLVAAVAGLGWLGRGLSGWLGGARTSDLTTIALFGALSFAVSAASQLVAMGVGAVLGPFSPLLVGVVDDALRTALWATLITLLPRPGVLSLSLLLGYLLRVLALGSMGPVDALFLGSHLFWLESCLWLAGLTRDPAWREGSRATRALRLAFGFGLASALSMASGLALSASFYRLFYAGWYAALLVALPGFAYSAIAAVLATRFSDALRRVES